MSEISKILEDLCFLPHFISAMFAVYRQFHMLQQNSYFPSRYFKWVKESFTIRLVFEAFSFCILSFLFLAKFFFYEFIFGVIIMAVNIFSIIHTHRKSVKPLVFTKRVWRLFVAAAILIIAFFLIGISGIKFLPYEVAYMIYLLFSVITPFLCLCAWCVTYPIEKAFNRYYINDAKKILKNMPRLTVIGVTGSYGKTTTKFILNRILSEKFNTVCTPQSFNTPLGVVRTVREKIKPQTEVFICEMGAKNKGDIKEICDIVNPSYGIITSVGPQHLETFKTVDTVFDTKFELCDSIEKNGKICLASLSSAATKERANKKPFCTYIGNGTEYFADKISLSAYGTSFNLHYKNEVISLRTKLLGAHAVSDILCAAVIARMLGVSAEDIKVAVSSLSSTEHRLELKPFVNGSLLIDDAYNSNPEGSAEAFNVLAAFEDKLKTVITPGLVELGEKEEEYNFALGKNAAKSADKIILVGKNRSIPIKKGVLEAGYKEENLFVVSSFSEALDIYKTYADNNSVLLIENDLPDNYLN